MSYQVVLQPRARREFGALPANVMTRVALMLDTMERDPRPSGTKKLSNRPLWRVRVGAFRIIYSIADAQELIVVERIARRNEHTYD